MNPAAAAGRRDPVYAQHDGASPTWYEASAGSRPAPAPLRGERSADVCVIGGGYGGLSAALHLAERGFSTVLLEARRVGNGASGRNGGQVGSGYRSAQTVLERELGVETARRLWFLAEEAKAILCERIARHRIDCALKPGIAIAAHRPRHARALALEAEHLSARYGYEAMTPLSPVALRSEVDSPAFCGGVLDRGAWHLHPLDYALGLARAAEEAGATIHEFSPAERLDPGPPCMVSTGAGQIRASAVVLACNGYLETPDPGIGPRIAPVANYILATEPLGKAAAEALIPNDIAVVDTRFVVDYFRLSADRRLLFGGGESYGRRFPADIARIVRPAMLRVFPQLAAVGTDYAWGGTLAITRSRMPDIGRAGAQVYYAQGFSGHGVALATLAGKLLAEAVAGTLERFDLFARLPHRPFPGGVLLRRPTVALAMTLAALADRV